MTSALLIARMLLAAVFLIAGLAKLADLAGSQQAMRDFRRASTASQSVWSAPAARRTGDGCGNAVAPLSLVGRLGSVASAAAVCGRHRLQLGTGTAAGVPLFRTVALGSGGLADPHSQPRAGGHRCRRSWLWSEHTSTGSPGLDGSHEWVATR